MTKSSLKVKFLLAMLLTTTIALMIACGAMVAFNLRDYRENVESDISIQAALLGKAVTPALQFHDPSSAQMYLELLSHHPNIIEAAIYDSDGKLFAGYQKFAAPLDTRSPQVESTQVDGNSLILRREITADGEVFGTVMVRIQYDMMAKLLGNLAIAIGSVFLAVAVSSAISLFLQRNVIGPLLSLSSVARRLAESRDYSLRAKKTSNDEIGYLVDGFNEMLDEVATGRRDLEAANEELKKEIAERMEAETALLKSEENILRLNADLERRVADRTAQLEVANQELESFSYSVSHDLRAPLRAIDGFSQALIEDYKEQIDDTGQDYLRRVRAAAQKMGCLIDDMLKLAKVNRTEMRLSEINISEMVDSILSELRESEPERQVTTTVEQGLTARCDPHLMKIALINLLNNAWKYTSKTETAEIRFGTSRFDEEEGFFVQDNGAGFDMAYADKLFGAFQRLHSAGEFPGTGVGLATVKRVISRHGGRIWAAAAPNQGATFFFTLPSLERSSLNQQ